VEGLSGRLVQSDIASPACEATPQADAARLRAVILDEAHHVSTSAGLTACK
jgi:hypothetical protein